MAVLELLARAARAGFVPTGIAPCAGITFIESLNGVGKGLSVGCVGHGLFQLSALRRDLGHHLLLLFLGHWPHLAELLRHILAKTFQHGLK